MIFMKKDPRKREYCIANDLIFKTYDFSKTLIDENNENLYDIREGDKYFILNKNNERREIYKDDFIIMRGNTKFSIPKYLYLELYKKISPPPPPNAK